MQFKVLDAEERDVLRKALRRNAEENIPLRMSPRDTSFVGYDDVNVSDEEVISLIRSVPCHY